MLEALTNPNNFLPDGRRTNQTPIALSASIAIAKTPDTQKEKILSNKNLTQPTKPV